MQKVNTMTEKQVEETRVFDMVSLQYVTVSMRYIKLF